jgi:hypothetical protein
MAELQKKTKCHRCKEKGHWKSECPQQTGRGNTEDWEKPKDKMDGNRGEKKSGGAYSAGPSNDLWINDSGANRHYCGRLDWFFEYTKYSKPKPFGIADNSHMLVQGVGKVRVNALIC